jgi:hypothetical protein
MAPCAPVVAGRAFFHMDVSMHKLGDWGSSRDLVVCPKLAITYFFMAILIASDVANFQSWMHDLKLIIFSVGPPNEEVWLVLKVPKPTLRGEEQFQCGAPKIDTPNDSEPSWTKIPSLV